jgi:hypothetical protein
MWCAIARYESRRIGFFEQPINRRPQLRDLNFRARGQQASNSASATP